MTNLPLNLICNLQGTHQRRKLRTLLKSYIEHVTLHQDPSNTVNFKTGVCPSKLKCTLGNINRGVDFTKAHQIADLVFEAVDQTFARDVTITREHGFIILTFNTKVMHRISIKSLNLNGSTTAFLLGE